MTPMSQSDMDMFDEVDFLLQEGYQAVDITIGELAALGAGTVCGSVGNKCFTFMVPKYEKRKVKCWFHPNEPNGCGPSVNGMVHIKVQTETTAEKIEHLADKGGGSLRFEGESVFEGYMEFEVE